MKIENKVEKDGDLSSIYNNNQNIDSKKKKKKYKILCIVVGILDFLEKFPFVLYNLIFRNQQ